MDGKFIPKNKWATLNEIRMDQQYIELLIFTITEKKKSAILHMQNAENDRIEFYRGQYLAFKEVISLLNNERERIINES